MKRDKQKGWAVEGFADIDLGDTRLNQRLVKLCNSFSEAPQSPINQACEDWAETKAAYRFFRNDNVDDRVVMNAHRLKTAQRAKGHKTVLAIQDTSYFVYTSHPKTEGLGRISMKKDKYDAKMFTNGFVMHSCLAVTTEGTPIGLLDQQIFARKLNSNKRRKLADVIPIEKKESYRWLEALKNSREITSDTQIVTVCDREADIYEFFKLSEELRSPVLVRAKVDRAINKRSRCAEKGVVSLWSHMDKQSEAGTVSVVIPSKRKKQHGTEQEARTAILTIKFGSFLLNPPRNNVKHRSSELPDLPMHAVYVYEAHPPAGMQAVEWMLLTNLSVTTFDEACEKVKWYCLRWRIEMYFKVLKSGFLVESCRLGTAGRLKKYLTIMSIVAWRMFMITLIARANPDTPCTKFITEHEWKILFIKVNRGKPLPKKTPTISEVVVWIARLGGFLGRKGDGMPGIISLWRGWKRLTDLTDGWNLAVNGGICG